MPDVKNPIPFLLVVDVWEKYNVMLQEMMNIEVNLQAHLEPENEDEHGQLYEMLLNEERRKYTDVLNGVRSLRQKASGAIYSYWEWYLKYLNMNASEDFLFDLVARRDCLLKQAEWITATMGEYQQTALQTRKFSFSYLESTPLLRRFNYKSFDKFASEYLRMQKYQVLNCLRELYGASNSDNTFDMGFKKASTAISSMRISLHWEHIATTRFQFFKIKPHSHRDNHKSDGHMVLSMPYWFLDLPTYLPVISHELAHIMLTQLKSNGLKKVPNNSFFQLQTKLFDKIYYFLMGAGKSETTAAYAEVYLAEFLADAIGVLLHGTSYLFPLFMDVTGMGLSEMYHPTSEPTGCTDQQARPERPKIQGYPWITRVRLAVWLFDRLNEDTTTPQMCREVSKSISSFLDKYEKATESKFSGFQRLSKENAAILHFHRKLFASITPIFEQYFVPQAKKVRLYQKTTIDENLLDRLIRHMETFRKKHGFLWNKGKEKDSTLSNFSAAAIKKIEDIPVSSFWTLGKIFSNSDDLSEATMRARVPYFPAGKRLFMAAIEDYFLKEAARSGWCCIAMPKLIKAIKDSSSSDEEKGNKFISKAHTLISKLKSGREPRGNKRYNWEEETKYISLGMKKILKNSHLERMGDGLSQNATKYLFPFEKQSKGNEFNWDIDWTGWNQDNKTFIGNEIRNSFLDAMLGISNDTIFGIEIWLLTLYKCPKPLSNDKLGKFFDLIQGTDGQSWDHESSMFALCSSYDFATLETYTKTVPLELTKSNTDGKYLPTTDVGLLKLGNKLSSKESLFKDKDFGGLTTSARLMVRLRFKEIEEIEVPNLGVNSSRNSNKSSLIIRLKLKSRGFHAFLCHQLIQGVKGHFSSRDKIFVSLGWEDMVLLFQEKPRGDLKHILDTIVNSPFVEKTQSMFIRHSWHTNLEHHTTCLAFDDQQEMETRIRVRLPHQNEEDVVEKMISIMNNHNTCYKVYATYGTHDISIRWKPSPKDVDNILDAMFQTEEFRKNVLSASTVIVKPHQSSTKTCSNRNELL